MKPARSLRYALFLGVGYAVFAALYIVVSSRIAAHVAVSLEQLERIETLKGVVFVSATALAVFFAAWAAMSRLERAHTEIQRRDAAILASERRVFAGLLAATTAHDANNVLVGVIADLHELQQTRGAEPYVERMTAAVERMIGLNRRLMNTVRLTRARETREMNLLEEVRAALESIRAHEEVRGCTIDVVGDEHLVLRSHPMLVLQILVNLVVNAAEATGGRGRIEVRLERSGPFAVIEVHDDGPGIPEERRAGLFDALATTKPGGTGLGLFSVKACADALGGSAEVTSSPLGGACFRVRLPLVPADGIAASAPAPSPRRAVSRGGPEAAPEAQPGTDIGV